MERSKIEAGLLQASVAFAISCSGDPLLTWPNLFHVEMYPLTYLHWQGNKYYGRNLSELVSEDPTYCQWILCESKALRHVGCREAEENRQPTCSESVMNSGAL